MRSTAATIAAAGLAALASAQSVSLSFSADATGPLSIGEAVEWTVSASFTGVTQTGYFGGFNGTLIAENAPDFRAHSFTNLMANEGTPPGATDGSVHAVNIFNHALLGSDDPSNPIDIFRFQTTFEQVTPGPTGWRFISYDAVGVASLFEDDSIFGLPIEFTGFDIASDRVLYYYPTPGAGVALISGLALSARRRRG